jgi:stress response protein SCP2
MAELGPSFRPVVNLQGGSGELLRFDIGASIEAAANTRFDLDTPSGTYVFGLGWDPLRNATFEKLYGASQPPDIDICVYAVNRWGEILHSLSSKGNRELPTPERVQVRLRANKESTYGSGIKISQDSKTGAGADDDEILAVKLKNLDDSVCSILVTASIADNASDFNMVKNMYIRVLDVVQESMEIELLRFRMPESCPRDSKTAVLMRLDRKLEDGHVMGGWELTTLGEFCDRAKPALPPIHGGEVLVGMRSGQVHYPFITSAASKEALAQGGVFPANIDRIGDLAEHCPPVTLKFARRIFREGSKEAANEDFEVTFNGNPCQEIQFAPQKLNWVDLGSLTGLSTSYGIPAVKSYYWDRITARPWNASLRSFMGPWATFTKPDRILVSDVKAYLFAADTGGTTDAYVRTWFKTLNLGGMALVKEAHEVEVSRSEVLKKQKCPGLAEFKDFQVVVPIEGMVGDIPQLIMTIRDKDWGIGAASDDTLIRHTINLSEFAYGQDPSAPNTNSFALVPDWVSEISDVEPNRGFTKDQVTLMYKVTLLYPGQGPPAMDMSGGMTPPSEASSSGGHVPAPAPAPEKKKGFW